MIYLILFFGLALRLISLNQSLWLDEATSALVVRNFNFAEIITKFSPGDFHPPLYYLLLKIWAGLFGTGEVGLRSLSVVIGVATVYLVYKISKSKLAALLLATSGLHIYYSQEARMYALATFLVCLSVFSFMKIVKQGRSGDWWKFSGIITLTAIADYLPIFILPVFWLYAAIKRKKLNWWKKFIASHIILVIVMIIWSPILIRQLSSGLNVFATSPSWWQILGTASLKNLLLIPIKFILGRISIDNKLLYGLISITLCTIYFGLMFLARSLKIAWLWLLVPIVGAVALAFKVSVLSYFRLLFVLPAFYLLVAAGITKLKGRWQKVALGLVLLVNLSSSIAYLFNPRFHREDWRSVAKALGSSPIVFPANSQKEALTYYGKGYQIINSDQIEKKDKEVWLSRYVWEVFDPDDTARQEIEQLGYNKTNEYNFNGVVIWQYQKE